MRYKPVKREVHERILQLLGEGKTITQVAQEVGLHPTTVWRLGQKRLRAELPKSIAEEYPPFEVESASVVLLLSDIHIPFHDTRALETAINYGANAKPDVVLLNGDVLDFHMVSRYDHDGTKLTYQEEIEAGRQFLAYLRDRFPRSRILYKEGNHEERLAKYILTRAPALFGLESVTVPQLLMYDDLGVEHIGDQRVIRIAGLRVIHGHEYGGSTYAPVNAARWLMLRARRHAIMGHMHHTSEQIDQTIDGTQLATWSVGCLCGLHPRYRRLSSRWNHGFAIIRVSGTNWEVQNLRIVDGRVV
jgi:predicted phosphodiesterase